ncbi:glutamate receptor-interacting protein 1 [Oopsacas minuta]|uniref:Glutamate receptor-interacting protein 1 n=1 Tax=Oopsacas minuta TaxID=111878 RepID=A0AAV7KMC9_9METZ|nr:glutamate receptor-interacting protein 1 [Oopsacas minuta]
MTGKSGGLQIGDVLLAINGQSLTNCTLNDAVQLLQETEDVVTLKISKEAQLLGPKLCEFNSITYTVELPKDKGNLGISIRGTSTAGSSVIVSHLMDGGVASRTEAIHVGDEILSVNGVSVKDKSLLDCARMLEEAEIVVALQIRKPDPLVKDSMLAQQYNTDYHVQCAVASPIPDPRDRIKHDIQSVAPTHQTNHGPPPIRAKPQLNSVTSYPIDSYRLAQETALRGRGRIHPTQHPLEPSSLNSHLPHTDYSNRKSTDLHSTSLTNITHLDRGSSMDSEGSSMYNSSPSPPQKKVSHQPREPSNLTKFVGGTHVPVRLHRSVETLPNSIEMVTFDPKKINKSRTMERGRTGIRDCHFTPVHEMDELGVYSIPLDQEPNEALTDQQIPDQSSAPALPRRNQALPSEQTQILSSRSVSGATWLDVPIKEAPPLPRIVATAQPSSNYVTLNTENGHTDTNNSQIQIQQRFRQPSFDSDIKKHSNQEVMKVQLYKQEKQSFGFSISDGNGNMGVFVKNVDAGSAADRGDLKPLDKLLAINGITIKELDCNRTLKLLKSSKDNLELVVSRLHLSAQNQTL